MEAAMKGSNLSTIGFWLAIVFLPITGLAAEFNVSTSAELQSALDAAATNSEDDSIIMESGAYETSSQFSYESSESHSLAIIGAGPDQTVLSGAGATRVLSIQVSGGVRASITVEQIKIINGITSAYGGGLYVNGTEGITGTFALRNCIFETNQALRGGGLYVFYPTIVLEGNTFRNNTIVGAMADIDKGGGGAHVIGSFGGNVSIQDNIFDQNLTGIAIKGGGLFVKMVLNPESLNIQRNSFTNNRIEDGTFTGNAAGGGAYVFCVGLGDFMEPSPPLNISHNRFEQNTAKGETGSGGGLFVQLGSCYTDLMVANNMFIRNSARTRGGAADLSPDLSRVIFTNNTSYRNTTLTSGGGDVTLMNVLRADIYNNILWGSMYGSDIDLSVQGDTVNLYHNDIGVYTCSSIPAEAGNISEDPRLSEYNFHVMDLSPVIDAGDNSAPGLPEFDIDGEARIINNVVDIGADEVNPAPPVECGLDGWCNPDCLSGEDPDCAGGVENCSNGEDDDGDGFTDCDDPDCETSVLCSVADFIVTEVEPIQVVEDPKGLIINKCAALRVKITSTFEVPVNLKVEATYNFGRQSYMEDGPDGSGIPIRPGENEVYIPGGPAKPGFPNSWESGEDATCLIWTDTGNDGNIAVAIDPYNAIEEVNETNNMLASDSIPVMEARTIRVLWVPVVFRDMDSLGWTIDPKKIISKEYNFMLETYPLAGSNIIFEQRSAWHCPFIPVYKPGSRTIDRDWLYEYVAHPLSVEARAAGYDRVVIAIPEDIGALGIAVGILREPEDRLPILCRSHFSTRWQGDWKVEESLVAHELGHTYYLWHPHDYGPAVYTANKYSARTHEYGDLLPTFMSYRSPFPNGMWIDDGRYNLDEKTRLPPGLYHFPGDDVAGIDPRDKNVDIGTWRWNLYDQFTGIDPDYMNVATVSGILDADDRIITEEPWYEFIGAPDALDQPGDSTHLIKLIDDKNNQIAAFPIRISHDYLAQVAMYDVLEPARTDRVPFSITVPVTRDTRAIRITDIQDNTLAERVVTAHSPLVEIVTPNERDEVIVGDTYRIEWNASDPDGDPLFYMILFSKDAGDTWVPLASKITETTYDWNTRFMEPAESYWIKVIACDGVNTGSDISDAGLVLRENQIVIDIKPGSCSNPINLKSKGVTPIAILGSVDFDVTRIDPDSIFMVRDGAAGYVRPVGMKYEDVAALLHGAHKKCSDLNGDGFRDLSLKFDTVEMKENLSLEYLSGQDASLIVFGKLKEKHGGKPFQGRDMVWVK
jgi:hypothetical protein